MVLVQRTTAKVESEAGTAVWHKLPCDTKRWGQLVCHHRQHLSNGGWRSKRPPDGCFGRICGGRLSMTTYLLCRRNCWKRQRKPPSLQRKMASLPPVGGGPRQCFGVFCNSRVLKDVVHSSMQTWRECLGVRRSISMMFWWKPFSCFDKQLVQPKIIVKLLGVESTILSKQFKRTPALMTMMRMLVTLTEMARWCFVSSVVTFECPRAKPLSCIVHSA